MYFVKVFGICALCLITGSGSDFVCNRKPLETKTVPLAPDNLFVLDIQGLDDKYIPDELYKVRLNSTEEKTSFIAFTIYITGDTKDNYDNPRLPIPLHPGRLYFDPNRRDIRTKCNNTLAESDTQPKRFVEALWQAPPKENKCVSIHAAVAIATDVWYNADGPLLKRVCEDRRKLEDMPPKENNNCQVCGEARYELRFEGMWTKNTHLRMFPETREARFSDVVGASHSNTFSLYKLNSEATEDLKGLAEQGKTDLLEGFIFNQLNVSVRTLIMATGPPKTNMSTVMSFRANRKMHLVSLVTAMMPSPDWFLGVTNLELCSDDNKWSTPINLNLYPYDAGTDSGIDWESSNEATSPPKPISLWKMKDIPKENIKPFAKLKLNLVKVYSDPNCTSDNDVTTETELGVIGDTDDGYYQPETERPSVSSESEEPPEARPDPTSRHECPMSRWYKEPCEGQCVDGQLTKAFRVLNRYFIINGKEIGRNLDTFAREYELVPENCRDQSTADFEPCTEECIEEEVDDGDGVAGSEARVSDVGRPGRRRYWGRQVKSWELDRH